MSDKILHWANLLGEYAVNYPSRILSRNLAGIIDMWGIWHLNSNFRPDLNIRQLRAFQKKTRIHFLFKHRSMNISIRRHLCLDAISKILLSTSKVSFYLFCQRVIISSSSKKLCCIPLWTHSNIFGNKRKLLKSKCVYNAYHLIKFI